MTGFFFLSGCCQDIRVSRPRPCAMAHIVLGSGVPLHPGVPEQPGIDHPGLPTSSREAFTSICLLIRPGMALSGVFCGKTDIFCWAGPRTVIFVGRDLGRWFSCWVGPRAVFFDKKRTFFGLTRLVAMLGGGRRPGSRSISWLGSSKRLKTFQTFACVVWLGYEDGVQCRTFLGLNSPRF